jgi:hypothetical protein
MDSATQLAQDKLDMIARDPELLRSYEQYEKAASDWTSGINGARQEERQAIARNFKALGVPNEQIAQGTGLSLDDIAKL